MDELIKWTNSLNFHRVTRKKNFFFSPAPRKTSAYYRGDNNDDDEKKSKQMIINQHSSARFIIIGAHFFPLWYVLLQKKNFFFLCFHNVRHDDFSPPAICSPYTDFSIPIWIISTYFIFHFSPRATTTEQTQLSSVAHALFWIWKMTGQEIKLSRHLTNWMWFLMCC